MSEEDNKEKPKSIMSTILKWIAIAAALVSLTLGLNQLNNLWKARKQKEATEIKIASLIKDAHAQANADDYETGWKTLEQAHQLNADSRVVQGEQVDFAMEWLRDLLFINRTDKYKETVSRLLPVLYHAANETKGQQEADIIAHIGWANFLQRFEVDNKLKIDELFEDAIKKDSLNAYAHAMWGFWMMKNQTGEQNLKGSTLHFESALRGKRDTAFVRLLQLWAFQQYDYPASKSQLFITVNNMRINGETINADTRLRIVDRAYTSYSHEIFEAISKSLSPADHLKTFNYLMKDLDYDEHVYRKLVLAQLTAKAGDKATALSIYESLKADSSLKRYSWYDEIERGLKSVE